MYPHLEMTTALVERAKWAFTTRRVVRGDAARLLADVGRAVAGDLVLARVERIGSHRRVQLSEGRPSELYEDDLIVAACGDRYAADQFEGIAELDPGGADLLAGGGVVGRMRARNDRVAAPTRVVPMGLLARADGRIVNVADYGLAPAPAADRPLVIGVVGTGMNSGKTTATASLVRGLVRAGLRVAAIKATGTGAFGDVNAYADAGACWVGDFTDTGMASTYRQPLDRIEAALRDLVAHAALAGCSVAVVEIADGVLQRETAQLLRNDGVVDLFDGFVLAAGDALGVAGGVTWLRGEGIEPVAVTGLVSRSPLASQEAEAAVGVKVMVRDDLLDPAGATALLARVRRASAKAAALGVAA